MSVHNLAAIMDGAIEPFVEALAAQDQAERLKQEVEV
jgi:hypothetical protein